MRVQQRVWRVLGAVGLLAGCTLSTDASDRKVVDTLDFEFTLKAFKPHAAVQVDVAVVTPLTVEAVPGPDAVPASAQKYTVRGRIRVLMPPDPNITRPMAGVLQPFPDVTVGLVQLLGQAYLEQDLQVLFYADTNNNFQVEPLDAQGGRAEHTWIRQMPENGELTFSHAANFQNFYDSEIMRNGNDLSLAVPDLKPHPARAACLDAELAKVMNKTLEVRLLFNPDVGAPQYAGFMMHAGNTLPTDPVLFRGVSDTGSVFGVQPLLDGLPTTGSSTPMDPGTGLVVPFEQWFPVTAAARDACLALP